MKFKVGDKVRVRAWEDMEKEFGLDDSGDIKCLYCFTRSMREYCGKVYTIARTGNSYELDGGNEIDVWSFSDDMLEPVCDSKIVITTDGETTLARLYENGEIRKSAKAECAPGDKYDFTFGAKLAFDRLTKPEPKFRVGDKVIGNAKSEYSITKEGWRGTVVYVHTDGYIGVVGKGPFSEKDKFFRLNPDCFDLCTEPEYYNGKVVCVETKGEHYAYTVGKIYEFKDGRVKIDNGNEAPCTTRVTSLDEWNDSGWTMAKFIELKE